jgi:hypothetical protein
VVRAHLNSYIGRAAFPPELRRVLATVMTEVTRKKRSLAVGLRDAAGFWTGSGDPTPGVAEIGDDFQLSAKGRMYERDDEVPDGRVAARRVGRGGAHPW